MFVQLVLDVATPERKGAFSTAVVDESHDELRPRRDDVLFARRCLHLDPPP